MIQKYPPLKDGKYTKSSLFEEVALTVINVFEQKPYARKIIYGVSKLGRVHVISYSLNPIFVV